ncbi:MAG: flagellar basal-body protein FlbY [Hyphomonadaceae bacterium]|nr:flagellar basal-body protein FlbY [Hyphomonadaceae bacterium]
MTSDSADRATQLLAMTQRLVSLVSTEVEAVKTRKLQGPSAEWDEKERLVHAWRIEVSKVKAEPQLLAGIPADLKTSLRDAAKALEDGLETHANALMATKTVTEGLVRSIAAEIASSRSAPAAYGRSGTVNPNARREASGLAVDAKA